jgi:hypothetical protein
MARDYEDIHDLDDLSDDELRQLVRDQLRQNNSVDANDINVHVENGAVRLIGRVGTEAEARIAERVVTDTLGLTNVSNELVADATRRALSPEAIDDHLADEEAHEGLLLGDRPKSVSDTDDLARGDEDLDERLFGTTDVQDTIAHGTPWIPPESPTPEGYAGEEGPDAGYGEQH